MENGGGARGRASSIALIAAFVTVLAFGGFAWFLVTERRAEEVEWARMTWVFASVEAVAFAAAGVLFGASIQRQRAETAEEAARSNADEAARGRALASALKAEDPEQAYTDSRLEAYGSVGDGDAARKIAARHASLARELFP